MVVDRHAHSALCLLLAHDVLGELVIDLVRRGKFLDGELALGDFRHVCRGVKVGLVNHVRARVHALVADEDPAGAGDELAHLAAALATERAVHLVGEKPGPGWSKLGIWLLWVCSVREVMTLSTRP